MSHDVFAGMFSHRNAQTLSDAMAVQANTEPAFDPDADSSFKYALDALPCNAMFCDRELILR
jgi:hypothetical protein